MLLFVFVLVFVVWAVFGGVFLFVFDLWLMQLHLFVVYVVVVIEFWAAWWYGCVVVLFWSMKIDLCSYGVLFYSCDVFV